MADSIRDLLRRLWRLNEQDGIQQSRTAPSGPSDQIATLDASRTARLSPMLKARYAFAGTWRNAALGQTWPGLDEIDCALGRTHLDRDAHAPTASRALPWEVSTAQVTLFGINHDTGEATYLIWRPGRAEPAICAVYGGQCDVFRDLRRFLEFLVGERVHDDSVAITASEAIEPGSTTHGQRA